MQDYKNTLVELFEYNAKIHANREAIFFENHVHTHAEIFLALQVQAAALAEAGIKRGDRVLLLSGNRPEVLILLGAVAWLGAILVPLNLRLSPTEMAQQAKDASARLVIVDEACSQIWSAAWPLGLPDVLHLSLAPSLGGNLICVGEPQNFKVARQDEASLAVLMLYTAAVEGHARGAVLSQAQLIASASQTGAVWSLTVQDRWLGVLPLFHAAGIGLALTVLYSGGACVLMPRFDPSAAVSAIETNGVTVCATFAPMLGAILDAAETHLTEKPLVSLRICMGLEPPGVIDRLKNLCANAIFWSAYGQAEVSSMVCLGNQAERPGAAGLPIQPTQVRIQNLAGCPVDLGIDGEIAVKGPTVFLGYWDVEKQQPFKPTDPWHRTGDMGRIDKDGWLWFTGRAAHKQLIKTGGENVYPAEVEQVLLDHPAIQEAFVFGHPDEKWGESVHAVCALKKGLSVTSDELMSFVLGRIARYKCPKSFVFHQVPLDRSFKRL